MYFTPEVAVAEDYRAQKSVAPGYPAVETLKDLDVSDWEPAAVFHPVDLSGAEIEEPGLSE